MPEETNNVPVRWFVLAVFVIVIIVALLKKDESGSSSSSRRYDPNSTTEENRVMIRDQMIKQGSQSDEAEVFTRELYNGEREHRRSH